MFDKRRSTDYFEDSNSESGTPAACNLRQGISRPSARC